MAGPWGQNLQDNLNIDEHIIHNLAHLLYSNGNRSCFGCPLCAPSQNRHISGLLPSIYPGIRSHSGCPYQDLFPKYNIANSYYEYVIFMIICMGYISIDVDNLKKKKIMGLQPQIAMKWHLINTILTIHIYTLYHTIILSHHVTHSENKNIAIWETCKQKEIKIKE